LSPAKPIARRGGRLHAEKSGQFAADFVQDAQKTFGRHQPRHRLAAVGDDDTLARLRRP